MGALNRAVAALLPAAPRSLVHLVARNYVAGTRLEHAIACVKDLAAEGCVATVDLLGEHLTSSAQADQTLEGYRAALEEIARAGVPANLSVKLTALGLKLDAADCKRRLHVLCEHAARHGNFVRVDMEDSSCTQATLDLYESLRRSLPNLGPVLQARLRRTPADARALAAHAANVRICKGIYVEPRAIAWTDREDIRRSYVESLEILLRGGCHVGIATHDEALVAEALRLVREIGVDASRYEFQVLLGVEQALRRRLVAAGHRLRVYVPFGERWYEYSIRRLKENPEIVGHVTRATVRRILGRA